MAKKIMLGNEVLWDGEIYDSHLGNVANPHSTTAAQTGGVSALANHNAAVNAHPDIRLQMEALANLIDGNEVLSAIDFDGATGREKIQNAIDSTTSLSPQKVVVIGSEGPDAEGKWYIDQAIEIPSNVTLILQDCYLFLVDGANDNIIRNADLPDGNENIHIMGIGQPRIDGNAINQTRDSLNTWKNIGILFFKVENFSIKNISIGPTEFWGISCEGSCSKGDIEHINFMQNDATPNQDGVNIRQGCSNIDIHDITGETGDDTIALTTIDSTSTGQYSYNSLYGTDIKNIRIWNVMAKSLGGDHIIRLLCADGRKIEKIKISNVQDVSEDQIKAVVILGHTLYGIAEPSMGDMNSIDISDISGGAEYLIYVRGPTQNVRIDGITAYGAWNYVFRNEQAIKNFSITNINADRDNLTAGSVINFADTVDGFMASNLFVNACNNFLTVLTGKVVNAFLLNNAVVNGAVNVFDWAGTINGEASNVVVDRAGVTGEVYEGNMDSLKFGPNMPYVTDTDVKPTHVIGSQVVAHPSWDPDKDGNGEIVVSDGVVWNEMVNLPNWDAGPVNWLGETWVEGYSDGNGSQSQTSDQMNFAISNNAAQIASRAYVTDNPIDLTSLTTLTFDWEITSVSVADSGNVRMMILIVSSEKMGDRLTYDERVFITSGTITARTTSTIDISDLSGNYYVRVHAVDPADGNDRAFTAVVYDISAS